MRTLIIVAVVICSGAAKPMSDWWRKLLATDGQFVLTQDRSYERGSLPDWSLEYMPSYRTAGAAAVTNPITGNKLYMGAFSSEEIYYPLHNAGTQGAARSDRVKALSDLLNTGLVDISDDYYHYMKLKSSPKYSGGQYYIDSSGEFYYRPATAQGQHQTGQASGSGVTVVKK